MSTIDSSRITVATLKELLQRRGLSTCGAKAELIARLYDFDPSGEWMPNFSSDDVRSQVDNGQTNEFGEAAGDDLTHDRREIDFLRREKALMEKELEVVKRELELARILRQSSASVQDEPAVQGSNARASVKTIAELLSYFDGKAEDFPGWKKQVMALRRTYRLNDDETRILMGMRLRGKALEWMHSRPEFLETNLNNLMEKFESMFYHRPSKLVLRKQFQDRVWRRDESFIDYYHDKTIKANRVPIEDRFELIDYLVEGIPDPTLRNQARMQCFDEPELLLRAFEKLTLSSSNYGDRTRGKPLQQMATTSVAGRGKAGRWTQGMDPPACFNCGEKGHLSRSCPTKERGLKCYRCGEHGHIAPGCPKREIKETVRKVGVVARSFTQESCKTVKVNDLDVAALVDTGSDLTLMKAECYVRIGAPRLQSSSKEFKGIGPDSFKTLGRFSTDVLIDGHSYPIEIFVIPDALLRNELLLGADFLNTVKITRVNGEVLFEKIEEGHNDYIPEIYRIECDQDGDDVDLSHIKDPEVQREVRGMIDSYVPEKTREVGVKMSIILKDDKPIHQRARRLAPAERDVMNAQLNEWLHDNNMTARIRKAQQDDEKVRRIFDLAEKKAIDGYLAKNGLLYKIIDDDIRLVVPKPLQSQLIRRMHENGHFAVGKTEALLRRDYWFQGLRDKVEKTISNCLDCILAERKAGKQEGFLRPISKGELPLDTYHIDHLGPLPATRKSYRHVLVIVDAFTKFVWLYTTKTTNTNEVLSHLVKQAMTFGNPRRIISDRGTAFTSAEFRDYCAREKIEHSLIVTGVPRGNGQVEWVNRTLVPLLSKLSAPRPGDWYRYLGAAQKYLNATPHRAINTSPFQLFFGTRMRSREDPQIRELLEQEWAAMFEEKRDETRAKAKESIAKIQQENLRSYNKRRKEPRQYHENDLVAIKRTQSGPGLKLAARYLGPYRVTRTLRHNRYMVEKEGNHEGPQRTTTVADFMKPWVEADSDGSGEENDNDEDVPRKAPEDRCQCRMAECGDEA